MNYRELTTEERIKKIERGMSNIKADEEQLKRIEEIRNGYKNIISVLLKNSKQSREQSLAITKLEVSLLLAVKGIESEKNE